MILQVREATQGDAAAIADIYNHAVHHTTATFDIEPTTPASREEWLAGHTDPRHPVLVAEDSGRVVAWGSLSPWSGR